MKRSIKGRGIISVIIMLILGIGLIIICPDDLSRIHFDAYVVNAICLWMSILLLMRLYAKKDLDIFEPMTIISAMYIVMYFVTPIYDICVGEFWWFGYELFKYSVEATLIGFAGFVAFYIFSTCYINSKRKNKRYSLISQKETMRTDDEKQGVAYIPLILAIYAFCFVANVFYLSRFDGNNLLYMLTLGILGDGGFDETTQSPIGFLSMFSYSLPAATLLYWEYGKSKVLKIGLFVPMVMLQVVRGFRFFVLQIAITFFVYYFLKKGKRPKLASIAAVLVAVMVPVVIMTMFRYSLRIGLGMDLSSISLITIRDALEEAIWSNFRIYQNFYGMVGVIPSQFEYVGLRQILWGTLFMVIPRIIWPGKLSSYGGYNLMTLIGKNIAAGQAYPNLGEYYYAFGTIGVIVFMGLYGIWMKYIRDKFMYSKNGLDIITFAILLGTNLQIIIRGYTPSNFWYVVFAIIPVWIIRRFGYKEVRK